MEEKIIKIFKEDLREEEKNCYKNIASYQRVVDRFIGNNMVLCNNIENVDNNLLCNKICGFDDYDDIKKEELEKLKEEYKEELENERETLENLEYMAEEYAKEEENNFFEYYIIDISNWNLEYLKKCKQTTLKIMYSELLDIYVLGVNHFGTSWRKIDSDFKLEIIE